MHTTDVTIPEHFICPLTMEMMKDPLFSKYGHTFERSAILEWLSKENSCPVTRQPLFPSMLIPHHALRLKIKAWKGAQEAELLLGLFDFDNDVDEATLSTTESVKRPIRRPFLANLRDEEEIQAVRRQTQDELLSRTLKHTLRQS
jgi:U-box domain